MKNILTFSVSVLVLLISSCSTSDDVMSSRSIQKRKYNRGFHVDLKSAPAKSNKTAANPASETLATLPSEEIIVEELSAATARDNQIVDLKIPVETETIRKNVTADSKCNTAKNRQSVWFGIKKNYSPLKSFQLRVENHENQSSFTGLTTAYDKSQLTKWIVVAVIGLIIAIVGRALIVWVVWYLGWLIWTLGVVMVILTLLEII